MRSSWLQSGVSMVQGMVISAVIAGSALVATRIMTTQKMALKTSETKDQIAELHKMIFGVLQNREHCLRTFASISLTPGTPQTISLSTIRSSPEATGSGLTQFVVNTGGPGGAMYMNNHVRINSITLRTTTNLGNPQPVSINYVRFEKGPNTRSGQGFGGKSITKVINVRLQRPTAGSTAIDGCYAVETNTESDTGQGNSDLNREFCERLGVGGSLYTWDSTRNTCVLKNNVCADKFVFEGIDSNGSAICRPFADYLPYFLQSGTKPCPSDKSAVAIVRDPVTNKVSIECSGSMGGGGASCTPPWGGSVAHGSCVWAYNATSANQCNFGPPYPTCMTCIGNHGQQRCCNNGVLSGTYTIQNCNNVCGGGMPCF